jgi:hypothetical protein
MSAPDEPKQNPCGTSVSGYEPASSDAKADDKSMLSTSSSSLPEAPNVSNLPISTNPADARHPTAVRSVSDTGPQRAVPPKLASSQSSGSATPLAQIQVARGLAGRPPSSSASSGSVSGGVSKLPAGMQAKMMAVSKSLQLCC